MKKGRAIEHWPHHGHLPHHQSEHVRPSRRNARMALAKNSRMFLYRLPLISPASAQGDASLQLVLSS
jgi:hypothetical protein